MGETYSPAFLKAIQFILPHEEAFARGHWGDENFVVAENVPGDAGGLTKYGIDASSHPGVDVANLTRDKAIALYWNEWKWRNFDSLPEKISVALMDVGVNGGYPVKWLQGALNKICSLAPALAVDGDLGPKTLAATKNCDQAAVLAYFLLEREGRFAMLAAKNPSLQQFWQGWHDRDLDLTKYLAVA